jgi:hypothetical protein
MGDQSTHIIPTAGDKISQVAWQRGIRELFEGCVLEGVVPADAGGLNLSVSSGKYYLGGTTFNFNGWTYILFPSTTHKLYAWVDRVMDPAIDKWIQIDSQLQVLTFGVPDRDVYMEIAEITTDLSSITDITINEAAYTLVPKAPFRFISLSDTPSTYVGQAGKGLRVKATEDGLEYFDVPGTVDKTEFTRVPNPGTTYNNYQVANVGSNGTENLDFVVPDDFGSVVKVYAIAAPLTGAQGAGKNIDLFSSYAQDGESVVQHQESDVVSTHQIQANADWWGGIDATGVFSNLSPGDRCGLEIKHNLIGGSVNYLGIAFTYTPA